jgi:hypothetical protein
MSMDEVYLGLNGCESQLVGFRFRFKSLPCKPLEGICYSYFRKITLFRLLYIKSPAGNGGAGVYNSDFKA